jgi:hypothetical protein
MKETAFFAQAESPVARLARIVKPLYETSSGNHSWEHIESVMENVDLLQSASPERDESHPWQLARVAVLVHDLDRANVPQETVDKLFADMKLSEKDTQDVRIAIQNHNKPKNRWTDAGHRVSQILYDADKMDTVRERFQKTKNVDGKLVESTENDYLGYVLMVRDSMTSPAAIETISRQLPDELRINLSDPKTSADMVKVYCDRMREVWQEVNLPMKRTVAKYLLMATSNPQYTAEITKAYPQITQEKIAAMSPVRKKWFTYVLNLKTVTGYFLDHIDEMADAAHDPMLDKAKLVDGIKEKMFVYDSMMQSIVSYPKSRESDIELLLDRAKHSDRLHENFGNVMGEMLKDQISIPTEELAERKKYFSELVGHTFAQLDHYSRYGDIDALKGGRRVLDQALSALYAGSDSASVLDIIDKSIENKDVDLAIHIVQHFRQDALRAVDRVNDAMRTDRYIYSLIRGQTIDSPVRKLPFIYRMDAQYLGDNGLHYYNPTHPQALHAMKMRLPYEQMPQILNDTIQLFTQGMYTYEDHHELVVNLFSSLFDESQVKPETFHYLLSHVLVNEEATITRHKSGRFVAENWLELDFSDRKNPNWTEANDVLRKINAYSKKIGLIPPLRPYAVCDKAINTTDDHIDIVLNPDAA